MQNFISFKASKFVLGCQDYIYLKIREGSLFVSERSFAVIIYKSISFFFLQNDSIIQFPICLLSYPLDQDNYQNLFGWLDNCFLVAYAIGMFFRYNIWPVQCAAYSFSIYVNAHLNVAFTLTAAFLESGCHCVTTWLPGCCSAAFSPRSLAWVSTGIFTPCGTTV